MFLRLKYQITKTKDNYSYNKYMVPASPSFFKEKL